MSKERKQSTEAAVREIRRRTRRKFSPEEKVRIVLEGLRGEQSVSELCRREGIAANLYCRWSKDFLEAGKKQLAGDTVREATSGEVKELRSENREIKEVVAEITLKNRVLKKKSRGSWRGGRHVRRTASGKMEIIRLVEGTDRPVRATLRQLGVPRSTFYGGYQRYEEMGFDGLHDKPPAPQPRWNKIPQERHDEVLDMTLTRTDRSPRELACRYTDEKRYFVSESSVYRILKAADLITSPAYVLMSASDRFQHPTERVHEIWQTDFTYFRIIGGGWYSLSTVLDDFSRYIIAWKLSPTMSATDVTETYGPQRRLLATVNCGKLAHMEPSTNDEHGVDPESRASAGKVFESDSTALQKLKESNARLATLQNLVQSYDSEMLPQWIGFSTTSFCNLRCPHCQTHGTPEILAEYNSRKWEDDFLQKIARETLPYAFEFNLGLNGEPLATPFIRQRLREFRKYGARLHLTTNGTLLSKKTIARVLPIASMISISIDGATKATCEAIRLDSKFEDLLYKIKLLSRTCELLPADTVKPDLRLAFTAMASNVRDMPELIRMAHFLGIPGVDIYEMVVLFSHVADEDMKLHKPLYNAYHERAVSEANRLGIGLYIPDPFAGVESDADFEVQGSDRIVKNLPDGHYDNLLPYKSRVDLEQIESEAKEIVDIILSEQSEEGHSPVNAGVVAQERARVDGAVETLLERHAAELEAQPGEQVAYCENLFKRTFVNDGGDVTPCCIPGRPELGNANVSSLTEIYNGEAYTNFRKAFFSSEPPDVCVGCRSFTAVPRQSLLDQIKGE